MAPARASRIHGALGGRPGRRLRCRRALPRPQSPARQVGGGPRFRGRVGLGRAGIYDGPCCRRGHHGCGSAAAPTPQVGEDAPGPRRASHPRSRPGTRARARRPGALCARAGAATSAAPWPPGPRPRPAALRRAARPDPAGSREPGAGAGAGRRAEVSAAAAGPAVVGCARVGRALVGCGPRGWAAGSGLGRRPGLRSAPGRRAAGRARPRAGPRAARRGRGAERGAGRPMDPRGPAPQTLRRQDRAQDVGLGRGATTRTGRRRGAAAAGARGRRGPDRSL